ncbi:MAG: peptidoglycan synthetase [Flammeovirgaceae bacterium]|nr:peptidoglycan synthetase [Flammeovirgaceae bacterium]
MRVHFIAIGGSIMHNLAIALKGKGIDVSGSDDEIFEPSLSKLKENGILPGQSGWFPEKINTDLDAVILGMHAKEDNPELKKALETGVKIYSFPEFVFNQSQDKQRVVIAGSHGKTTVTAMITHVLNYWGKNPDYLIGAATNNLKYPVKLTEEAPLILLEGDEYPSSTIDKKPKFFNYQHHIGVITGIAWDHINVFPTFEIYCDQFKKFIEASVKAGTLIYSENDATLKKVIQQAAIPEDVLLMPYGTHKHKIENGNTYLISENKEKIPVSFFGEHNLQNVNAALMTALRLGIVASQFYEAIQSFDGASRRLELIGENQHTKVFKDFAHAPSKLVATINAVKNQFPEKGLVACMELHTFSSLNKDFTGHFNGTMNEADVAIVYYNPETVALKRLEPISPQDLRFGFNNDDLLIFTDSREMEKFLLEQNWDKNNLLLMSSGNFNNLDLNKLTEQILS